MVLYLAGLITYLILKQFGSLDSNQGAPANPTNLDEPSRVSPRTSVPVQDASTVAATHPPAGQPR